jgi:hypothetical protein
VHTNDVKWMIQRFQHKNKAQDRNKSQKQSCGRPAYMNGASLFSMVNIGDGGEEKIPESPKRGLSRWPGGLPKSKGSMPNGKAQ